MTVSNHLEVLDETSDYHLVVGEFPFIESVKGRRSYGVINKVTKVVEAVGPGLPSAMTTLYSLQEDLDGVRGAIAQSKAEGVSMFEGGVGDPDFTTH